MYAEERQQMILERARTRGRVDVAELAGEFTVTTETIRRDLTTLERHGSPAACTAGRSPSSGWVSNRRSPRGKA